jgi:type I restriction enzyme S subunit
MTEGGDLDKLGRGTVWNNEIADCLHQNHVFAVRPNQSKLMPEYLALLTQTAYARAYFESTGTKTTNLASTSSSKIRDFKIPLVDLGEQLRIVNFINVETAQIDGLATARRRMRDLLILRRERTVEQILGLDADPPFIPLKYVAQSVSVGIVITPANWYVDEGGVPALRGLNVKPGRIDSSDIVQISYEGHRENMKSRLSAGDVVVVRTGQAGAAVVVPAELDGSNCVDLLIIRPGRKVDPSFLAHYLNSFYAQDKITEHSVGSIQSHFNVGSMKNLDFPNLDLAEQQRRASRLKDAIGEIDLLNSQLGTQLDLLAERRQALITAAVMGGISV